MPRMRLYRAWQQKKQKHEDGERKNERATSQGHGTHSSRRGSKTRILNTSPHRRHITHDTSRTTREHQTRNTIPRFIDNILPMSDLIPPVTNYFHLPPRTTTNHNQPDSATTHHQPPNDTNRLLRLLTISITLYHRKPLQLPLYFLRISTTTANKYLLTTTIDQRTHLQTTTH